MARPLHDHRDASVAERGVGMQFDSDCVNLLQYTHSFAASIVYACLENAEWLTEEEIRTRTLMPTKRVVCEALRQLTSENLVQRRGHAYRAHRDTLLRVYKTRLDRMQRLLALQSQQLVVCLVCRQPVRMTHDGVDPVCPFCPDHPLSTPASQKRDAMHLEAAARVLATTSTCPGAGR